MISIVLIFIAAVIHSSFSGDCYVMQYQSISIRWSKSEYLIVAEESCVINVTCRCSFGRPMWRGTRGALILSSAVYCKDNGTSCPSDTITSYSEDLFVFTDLTNYVVNESTILQCGNEIDNFAQAIEIVITQVDTSASCLPMPSASYSPTPTSHSPTPSHTPFLSQSPSPSPSHIFSLSPSPFFPSFVTSFPLLSSTQLTQHDTPGIVLTKCGIVVTETNVVTSTILNSPSGTDFPGKVEAQIERCIKENYLAVILVVFGIAVPMIVIIIILSVLLCVAKRRPCMQKSMRKDDDVAYFNQSAVNNI